MLYNLKERFKTKSSVHLLFWFFMLTITFDFIDKWSKVYEVNDIFKFNKYLKLLFIILSIIVSFKNRKHIKRELVGISIITIWVIFNFYISKPFEGDYLVYLLRYLFLFSVLPLLYIVKIKNLNHTFAQYFYLGIDIVVVFNFIAIIIGFFFGEDIFRTYNATRFGYNGIMLNQMQSPYIYLSFLFILYYQKKHLIFFITLVSALLMGVKALYLGVFLFAILKIIFLDNKVYKKKIISSIVVTIGFVLIIGPLMGTNIFKKIVDSEGLLTALFSHRNEHLISILNKINRENFNFLFGCKDLEVFRCEFGLIDLFLFFGFFGLILYSFIFIKIHKYFCVSLISKIYFIVIFIIISLAGNFFYFPINVYIFLCTLILLNNEEDYFKVNG